MKFLKQGFFTACVLWISVFLPQNLLAQQDAAKSMDYSKAENWIFQPENSKVFGCDVFYVYPTVFFGDKPAIMDLQNHKLRDQAMGVAEEHTGVFSGVANVYAPYYRQVSIAVLSLSDMESKPYLDIAYQDVENAFDYYLDNLNNGRPFFLAGHSQGSVMLLMLMKNRFNDEKLLEQLIAAYTIGFSITDEELTEHPWMKIAQAKDDLGVIIIYNTQSPDAKGSPVLLPGAKCVNPLIWTTSQDYAANTLNLGAAFFDDNHKLTKTTPQHTDAVIGNNGALIVTGPNPDDFFTAGESFFPRGVFHAYDYGFFFNNLKANAQTRWDAYRKVKNLK